jgi:hypothetical protein
MSDLTRAHQELHRRSADERFASLQELREHCQHERQFSSDCWYLPQSLDPRSVEDRVTVRLGDDGEFLMNDWSFSQLCRLSGVTKGTLNHIVWDAVEVVEFTRKHTANVRDGLQEIGRIVESLVAKRDARRDGFVRVLTKAMRETLGSDAEAVAKELARHGIPRNLGQEAIEVAREQGRFTIFALVAALTRLAKSAW